jgi:hypothetical protein
LKEQALRFVDYLNENQMQPQRWFDENFWHIPYGEYWLFGIFLEQNKWNLFFFSGDYKGEFKEGFIKTIQDRVNTCVSCHGDNTDICPKGKDMTIFGKEFKKVCIQFTIHFENPKDNDFIYIKELIEYYKGVVSYSDSFHAH